VEELSSCKCDRWSLWPKRAECLFSGTLTSTVLRDDLGRLVEDEARDFELRAVNLNR